MRQFMDKDFMLTTESARALFHNYAEKMPILDYHCHINPKEIAEDRKFDNITQVWLGGDHYKWRQMRSNGVDERYITGDASDREKFQKWAETLEKLIGNPLYHWSHLELEILRLHRPSVRRYRRGGLEPLQRAASEQMDRPQPDQGFQRNPDLHHRRSDRHSGVAQEDRC